MELGATVCTPRQPACADCPLARRCVAKRERLTSRLPNLGERAKATTRRFVAFVVERRTRFLVRQRPGGAVNARLWELPNVEIQDGETPRASAQTAGFDLPAAAPLVVVNHTITRYRIALAAFRAKIADGGPRVADGGRWYSLSELDALPFTSAHRKILCHLSSGAAVKD